MLQEIMHCAKITLHDQRDWAVQWPGRVIRIPGPARQPWHVNISPVGCDKDLDLKNQNLGWYPGGMPKGTI